MRKLITMVLLAVFAIPVLVTGGCGTAQADGGTQMKSENSIPEIDTTYHAKVETATFALG